MESVASFLKSEHPTALSFEILPPVRGGSIERTLDSIRPLMEFAPAYVNITTHRNEVTYNHVGGGSYRACTAQKRPGTVAIAALLRERFGVRPVPHIICGDYTENGGNSCFQPYCGHAFADFCAHMVIMTCGAFNNSSKTDHCVIIPGLCHFLCSEGNLKGAGHPCQGNIIIFHTMAE